MDRPRAGWREMVPWVALPPLLFGGVLLVVWWLTRDPGVAPFIYAAH